MLCQFLATIDLWSYLTVPTPDLTASIESLTLVAPRATWLLPAVQAAGLAVAWLTRLTEGTRWQAACQALFLAALAATGCFVLAMLGGEPGHPGEWLLPCLTLVAMTLIAAWDSWR